MIGGMRARQILLATPLLKWYLEHGMVVTKIYQVIEFTPQRCFREFVKEVSDNRRLGDAHPDKAIIAETSKLHGNGGYGGTIMDQDKFQSVIYVEGEGRAMLEANKPQFRKMTALLAEEEFFEVEKSKKELRMNLPVQIGHFILQYGKLRMLQFYFDFLDVYVERENFAYCEMDTDSAYMALAGPVLASVIKPHMREKYHKTLTACCRDDVEPKWFPRTCCTRHAKYDKRTPGLFKVEYEGDVIIGLCSKTYIVQKTKTVPVSSTLITAFNLLRRAKRLPRKRLARRPRTVKEVKFSSKGVSKKRVEAPMTIFRRVLKTQRPGHGMLRGLRARRNGISTYKQSRKGFSYFYCKRRLLNDGVSIVPLDIELCPIKKKQENDDMNVEESEESRMEISSEETPMDVKESEESRMEMSSEEPTMELDDLDRYLVSLMETNFESDDDMS